MNRDLPNCYYVSKDFQHYGRNEAKERLHRLNSVEWTKISFRRNLCDDFIYEFNIKSTGHLFQNFKSKGNRHFIHKFKDKVNWIFITEFQKLSEDFITEFKVEVNWNNISRWQNLSEDFVREFKS